MSEENAADVNAKSTAEITFKTISSQTFKLTFPLNTKIADVKKRIFDEKGDDFEVDRQKLIYNGKVLEDSQELHEINVDDKKYIVVMAPKKRVPIPSFPNKMETAKIEKPSTTQPASSAALTATTPTTAGAFVLPPSADAQFTLPSEYEEMCASICNMGYPRDKVIHALRAAFFNGERAVEYLCSGIPESLDLNAAEVGDIEAGSLEAEMSDVEHQDSGPLSFLRDSPQFAQICQIVRGHPELLPQVLSEISHSNPELMQTIRENQETFVMMLNEVSGEDAMAAAAAVPEAESEDQEAAAPHDSGQMTIAVTETDRQAIQRLQAMGFPEQLVIEAYIACDKNEDLAVNYILSRMDEAE